MSHRLPPEWKEALEIRYKAMMVVLHMFRQSISVSSTNIMLIDTTETLPRKEKQPPQDRPLSLWRIINEWWTLEIGGAVLSLACLGGILIICAYLKDKPLSHWRSSISANSVISTLTTLSKAGILVSLSGTISQCKWIYYQENSQRLGNIDVFHEASQGALGALNFLLKMKASSLITSIASVITIIALAFEPMAQQVLSYNQTLVEDPAAASLLPVAQIYSSRQAGITATNTRT